MINVSQIFRTDDEMIFLYQRNFYILKKFSNVCNVYENVDSILKYYTFYNLLFRGDNFFNYIYGNINLYNHFVNILHSIILVEIKIFLSSLNNCQIIVARQKNINLYIINFFHFSIYCINFLACNVNYSYHSNSLIKFN